MAEGDHDDRVRRRGRARTLWRDVAAALASPVTRSIALWVLASILLVELAILVPSLIDRRSELVAVVDERNRYAAGAVLGTDVRDSIERIAQLPEIDGIAWFDADGRRVGGQGTEPTLKPGELTPGETRILGDRAVTVWQFEATPTPATAVVALDVADLDSQLFGFGLRVIGLVFIISVFVTAVTMAIVGSRVLRPLTRITSAVREARRTGRRETVDPEQPGEFGELVAHYNATINEQKKAEQRGEQLYYQAMHDPLTGLPNRALLADRLQQAVERAGRYGEEAAVMLLDLDRFKLFNDSHGHAAGDELLRRVAGRVQDVLRNSDTVARIGGDEFAVIQPRIGEEADYERLGERLRSALADPFDVDGVQAVLAASIGVTLLPEDGTDSDSLLVNADLAMYRAKHCGGDRVCRFRPAMRDDMVRQITMEQALEHALAEEQFMLYYQPILDLGTDEVTSFEALVRWNHPEWGLVPPNHFLPLVEQTGMIAGLGDWVLARAAADLSTLRDRFPACRRVAVNVAAGQLAAESADALVSRALAGSGVEADQLTLEITESEVLESPESTIEGLERASRMGVLIAIDDFGTGYSSLAQVQDLPGHVLKIDRRFVQPLAESRRARDLFAAVVSMGRSLGMRVVAEGIETPDQLEVVRASGCDFAQGYLLGHPRSLQALHAETAGAAPGDDPVGGRTSCA